MSTPIASLLHYAIGDVHGCADLLVPLLQAIERDAVVSDASPRVTFLGDIIDRGPDSRRCLDIVAETLDRWPGSRLLLGNHDDCLLALASGRGLEEDEFASWLDQGGREALASYGLDETDPATLGARIARAAPGHVDLLAGASTIEIEEDFAFVHAGVDPAVSIFAQSRRDCLRIRAPFMRHVGRLERVVVHGHTPQKIPRPVATENRISLDTGAFFSGVLTALVIDRPIRRLRFLATSASGTVAPVEPIRFDRGLGSVLDDWQGQATGEPAARKQPAP